MLSIRILRKWRITLILSIVLYVLLFIVSGRVDDLTRSGAVAANAVDVSAMKDNCVNKCVAMAPLHLFNMRDSKLAGEWCSYGCAYFEAGLTPYIGQEVRLR